MIFCCLLAVHTFNDSPLTSQPGGPVDTPVNDIAKRNDVEPEQVLLAWAKAKGTVVVTYVINEPSLTSVENIDVRLQV